MNGFCSNYGKINDQYNRLHGHKTEKGKLTRAGQANDISKVALLALSLVGLSAVTGTLSPAVAGGIAAGLGVVVLLLQAPFTENNYYKIDLVSTALYAAGVVAFGAFGGAGILSGAQMGYTLIGFTVAKLWFEYGMMRVYHEMEREYD